MTAEYDQALAAEVENRHGLCILQLELQMACVRVLDQYQDIWVNGAQSDDISILDMMMLFAEVTHWFIDGFEMRSPHDD